ncbi:MAG: hypothetical protein ACRDJH_17695 [Thermomicrobiales bacterium]
MLRLASVLNCGPRIAAIGDFGGRAFVSSGDEESIDTEDTSSPTVPRLITADPRKFSHYVLDPGNAKGKDHIYINFLGYRVRSDEDARELAAIYVAVAQSKVAAGEFSFGSKTPFGRRIEIVVQLGGLSLRSGWILNQDGTLALATPFRGCAAGEE